MVRNLLQGYGEKISTESRDKLRIKSDGSSTSGTKPAHLIRRFKQKEAAGKSTNTKVSPVKK